MSLITLSITVENALLAQLDAVVLASNRNRQYHLRRALDQYLATAMDELNAIDDGIADTEAGRLTDLETVRGQWHARNV